MTSGQYIFGFSPSLERRIKKKHPLKQELRPIGNSWVKANEVSSFDYLCGLAGKTITAPVLVEVQHKVLKHAGTQVDYESDYRLI